MENETPETLLVVAIDFGTTWSGVCWAFSDDIETHRIIREWPGIDGNETSDKVPTRIAYDTNNGSCAWGLMIKSNELRFQEFKLELDDSTIKHKLGKLAQEYTEPLSIPFKFPFVASRLSVDFLRILKEWLELRIDAEVGIGTFASMRTEYVITCPAIWSDKAKSLTSYIAKKAGLGKDVKIISEPEAAMVHAIQNLSQEDIHEFGIGDCFTLCDAGGGTVDLITYKITALEPLRVEEIVIGNGGKCGSVYLDRQFKRYLEHHFKNFPSWTAQNMADACDRFEKIVKRKFTECVNEIHAKVKKTAMPEHDKIKINVPNAPNYDKGGIQIKKGKLFVPAADIAAMFKSCADAILFLINQQISQTTKVANGTRVKGLVLVGGFGQSEWLRNWLKDKLWFNSVKLYVPKDAWTAVVRGALARIHPIIAPKSSQAIVSSRIARRSYGITYSRIFNALVDESVNDKKFYVPLEKKYYIETIHWFLGKGTKVKEGYRVERGYVHSWPANSENRKDAVLCFKIYSWDGEVDEPLPVYPSVEGIKLVAALDVDCSRIHRSELTGKDVDGEIHLWCGPWLHITYNFASISYILHYKGQDYGSVETGFEA